MTVLSVTDTSVWIDNPGYALRTYGAIILSFLGGVQWGLAIRNSDGNARTRRGLTSMLTLSIVPSLIGWAGLLIDEPLSFGLLISGFVLVLFTDVRAAKRGMAPRWYLRLRYTLTGLVVTCLVVAAVFKP